MDKADQLAPPGAFDRWPAGMQAELEANRQSAIVGSTLVSETDRVRVWHLLIPAGKRCAFHVHVLDYFWTCHTQGTARSYYEDGSIVRATFAPGDTKHMTFAKGHHMRHAVENTGSTDLLFTAVEFLDSANAPLPIPDGVRLTKAA
jgi:beta-alanine degradation protein BauB